MTPHKAVDISFVVITFNSSRFIDQCIQSIRAHVRPPLAYELVMVDNCSVDGTAEKVSAEYPDITLMRSSSNVGFAAAMNLALRCVKGRIVCWLNPDARLVSGSVDDILAFFDLNPDVGIIGPKVLNTAGLVEPSCRSFPNFATAFAGRWSLLARIFPNNPYSARYLLSRFSHDGTMRVDWVSGGALFHRRSVIDSIGLLDEAYFMYVEDVDFCKRASESGWTVYFHPGLSVEHAIGGCSKNHRLKLLIAHHRSMWIYCKKHLALGVVMRTVVGTAIALRCSTLVSGALLSAFVTNDRRAQS